MLLIIVLLEDPMTTQFYFHGRGSQIKIENVLVFHVVHDAMHPNKVPRKNSSTTSQNFYLHHTYIQDIFGIGLSVGCRKATFSFYLTIEYGSSQSSSST